MMTFIRKKPTIPITPPEPEILHPDNSPAIQVTRHAYDLAKHKKRWKNGQHLIAMKWGKKLKWVKVYWLS